MKNIRPLSVYFLKHNQLGPLYKTSNYNVIDSLDSNKYMISSFQKFMIHINSEPKQPIDSLLTKVSDLWNSEIDDKYAEWTGLYLNNIKHDFIVIHITESEQ